MVGSSYHPSFQDEFFQDSNRYNSTSLSNTLGVFFDYTSFYIIFILILRLFILQISKDNRNYYTCNFGHISGHRYDSLYLFV